MIVKCGNQGCPSFYDDEFRWTICPHNHLYVPADAIFCIYHDLYNCNLCLIESTHGELLEALKALVAALDAGHIVDDSYLTKARGAIAKADMIDKGTTAWLDLVNARETAKASIAKAEKTK